MILFLLLVTQNAITPAKATTLQDLEYPVNGKIYDATPSYIKIHIPETAEFLQEKTFVIASNNKNVPIRSLDKKGNTITFKTSALPPGKIKVHWEFKYKNEIIKKEKDFAIEVNWSMAQLDEPNVSRYDTKSSENNKSTKNIPKTAIGMLLTIAILILLTYRKISKDKKTKFLALLILVGLITSQQLYPKLPASAESQNNLIYKENQKIQHPAECTENNFELGFIKCLRLWSLQAASKDPTVAKKQMKEYIVKFKGTQFDLCETIVEYTFEAITLTKGVSEAFSLVGGKDCGHEGPDTRGIFKSAATFAANYKELMELENINKECNNKIKTMVGEETALSCRFPVPWYLLQLTNADLTKTLEYCEKQEIFTPTNKCQFWVFGVFFGKYIKSYQDLADKNPEEVLITPAGKEAIVCEQFINNKRKLCYAQAAQSYGYSVEALKKYQEQCYKLPKKSKSECFEGVGYPLGNFLQITFQESIKPCLEQPKSEQRGCVVWAITGRSSHHGESIEGMIESIPGEFKENILSGDIEEDINSYGKNI